jgi:hypothetical protein
VSEERLRPARPDDDESTAYGPRVPWLWIVLGAVAATILGGGWYWRESEKESRLRGEILSVYDQRVAPVGERYRTFRDRIDGWVAEVARQDPPEPFVDPRLRISALHTGQGVYLRLRADAAGSPADIERGAREMGPDAITRCMGITPLSLRGFYEQARILDPAWRQGVVDASGVMRLRVLDDELRRGAETELPNALNAIGSRYFLLVLQRGPSRRDAPVDVFMWDLRAGVKLLSTRTDPDGVLVPVRARFEGAPPSPRVPHNPDSMGAVDCSIASQVKALTGEPAMTFGSEIEAPPADAGLAAEVDAGAATAAPDAGP